MSNACLTRFAPSPTGSLHVGGVRTALYCRVHAHQRGGTFVLRIEDTDRKRSTDEAAVGIVRDLQWLGLSWDEGPGDTVSPRGPFYQSQRLEHYQKAVSDLLAAGAAYEAWDTPEELAEMRKAAERSKENFAYRRRSWSDDEVAAFRAAGRKPVVRFVSPAKAVTVPDLILGDVTVDGDRLDDFVLLKADGWPTYHMAVVVDDHLMGVTLVLRGQEHLMNTHKHLQLYDALGWTPPQHAHLPLIFGPDGGKMSKRDKAKAARAAARNAAKEHGWGKDWQRAAEAWEIDAHALSSFMAKKDDAPATVTALANALTLELPMIDVDDFRAAGFVPEALINYLSLLGWSPGDDREVMTSGEIQDVFDLSRVNKTAARFDVDKLTWMNGQYLQHLPLARVTEHFEQWLKARPNCPLNGMSPPDRGELMGLYRARAKTFVELERQSAFFSTAPTSWDAKQIRKHLDKNDGWQRLASAREALAATPTWDNASIDATLAHRAEALDVKPGQLAHPVRIAITGNGVSPEIGPTLALLGRAETLSRIDSCSASASA